MVQPLPVRGGESLPEGRPLSLPVPRPVAPRPAVLVGSAWGGAAHRRAHQWPRPNREAEARSPSLSAGSGKHDRRSAVRPSWVRPARNLQLKH